MEAHEAFHYPRETRQVGGRRGEIEADAFALKMLERYRGEPERDRATSLNHLAERSRVVEVRKRLALGSLHAQKTTQMFSACLHLVDQKSIGGDELLDLLVPPVERRLDHIGSWLAAVP